MPEVTGGRATAVRGTQFGMLIRYRMEHPETPDSGLYPRARAVFDSDDDFAERARERVVAVESQGAWCVFFPDREAPLTVRKKDGGFGYTATDLAALRYRIRELRADRVLYVIDARQAECLAMGGRSSPGPETPCRCGNCSTPPSSGPGPPRASAR